MTVSDPDLSLPSFNSHSIWAEHYNAFADALPHHAGLLNHLGLAQAQAQETRIALQEAKEALGSRRADLVQLWSRGQTLEEMIRLLDEMSAFFCCIHKIVLSHFK